MFWVPSQGNFDLSKKAKNAAREATKQVQVSPKECYQAKSTTINLTLAAQRAERSLPIGVGKYSREMDIALPGTHTRTIYDTLKKKEATILAQLRTGIARLNGYLHMIGVAESDLCVCERAKETIKHFLFRCTRWEQQRTTYMLEQSDRQRGNLSFHLGGKSASDKDKWSPNMNAVRATIKYAMATGRLDTETAFP
jgi:hypothetical protein